MATTDDEAIALCALLGGELGLPGQKYWRYKLDYPAGGIMAPPDAPAGWSGIYLTPHEAARAWLLEHGYRQEAKKAD